MQGQIIYKMVNNSPIKKAQVVMFVDIRNFLATSAYIEDKHRRKIDKFYELMAFYYIIICEMFLPLVSYLIKKRIKSKKDIVSNIFTNPTGDGMLLVIEGEKSYPDNIIASYIFAICLNVMTQAFAEKMKEEFKLKRLIPSSGIAIAFGKVRKVEYEDHATKYTVSTFLSNIINRAARIESLNKGHSDTEISLDSSFANELYKIFYPGEPDPHKIMKRFEKELDKKKRLDLLRNLFEKDMELLLYYKGKHNFKGGQAIIHAVSKVLVKLSVSKDFKKIKKSKELREFYEKASEISQKKHNDGLQNNLIKPMEKKILELMKKLKQI